MSGFGATSLGRLSTCHPLLQALLTRVIRRPDLPHDLAVLCGHRGQAEQDAAAAAGRSRLRWPQSAHNRTPSHAVDVAPYVGGAVSWEWRHYNAIAPVIKAEWAKMQTEGAVPPGVALEWGGDWTSLRDGPHWQIVGAL